MICFYLSRKADAKLLGSMKSDGRRHHSQTPAATAAKPSPRVEAITKGGEDGVALEVTNCMAGKGKIGNLFGIMNYEKIVMKSITIRHDMLV